MSLDPSSAISSLKWIGSLVIEKGKYLYQIPEEVHSLLDELRCMVLLLQKVDVQQGNFDSQLHIFSEKIRELAFRSEDVIDTYFLEYSDKIEKRSFLMKFACLWGNSYQINKIGTKIESIKKEVEVANARLQRFQGVVPNNLGPSSSSNIERLRDAPGRALFSKDEFVVGIENDIRELVTLICKSESSELSFFAIVGTGGAGKTTLVKKIFDHSTVKKCFNAKALISISQEWDDKSLLAEIIRQSMGNQAVESFTKLALIERLREFLEDKRYLIVLDDIWYTSAWDHISGAFPRNRGSAVVVTTRIGDIPSYIHRSCYVHEPKSLEEEEKYKLFHKIAIEGRETSISTIKKFEDLGREMSKKCSGTPLAVVSLAGILRTKDQLYQWEEIKSALSRNILKGKGTGEYGNVKDMLSLSYYDLPLYLRPCLLYLATYPEDHKVKTKVLIRLWISEGLVTNADSIQPQETLEDIGARFLNELDNRCLLITIKRNYEEKLRAFQMHDLVRDFCIEKVKEQKFLKLIYTSKRGSMSDPGENTEARRVVFHSRHQDEKESQEHAVELSKCEDTFSSRYYIKEPEDNVIQFSECGATTSLRSLIQFGLGRVDRTRRMYRSDVQHSGSIHTKFKLLKILHLSGISRLIVPEEIGNLINLSYFGARDCELAGIDLFKSVKTLRNLMNFDFQDTVQEVQEKMFRRYMRESNMNNIFVNMEKLRYVCLPYFSFGVKTLGLTTSKNLQVLRSCPYGPNSSGLLNDLPKIERLRKLNVKLNHHCDIDLVYQCPSLTSLQSLKLYGPQNGRFWIDMQKLKHCSSLRKLAIGGLSIIEEYDAGLPFQFPRNLVSLELRDTKLRRQESLASISELPYLKYLDLGSHAYEGEEWIIQPNTFLDLEELKVHTLTSFKGWRVNPRTSENGSVILPCLRKINNYGCNTLPEGLQHVATIKELNIWMEDSAYVERVKEGKEDYHIIQHIPLVSFHLNGDMKRWTMEHGKISS